MLDEFSCSASHSPTLFMNLRFRMLGIFMPFHILVLLILFIFKMSIYVHMQWLTS